jgi:hypothetical protein
VLPKQTKKKRGNKKKRINDTQSAIAENTLRTCVSSRQREKKKKSQWIALFLSTEVVTNALFFFCGILSLLLYPTITTTTTATKRHQNALSRGKESPGTSFASAHDTHIHTERERAKFTE